MVFEMRVMFVRKTITCTLGFAFFEEATIPLVG